MPGVKGQIEQTRKLGIVKAYCYKKRWFLIKYYFDSDQWLYHEII